MRTLSTVLSGSIFLLLILISFFCTDPVKPDFTEPPVISNNGAVSTFGSLNCDSLFGLFITVSGTAPFTYQWYKNDSIIPLGVNDTLLFSAISPADSGNYFCIVANTEGSDTSLSYAVVPIDTMPKPPIILDSGAVHVFGSLQVDSAFGMFIRATGTAPIAFTWYKNDTAIASAPDNDTLLFPALSFTDSGSYYCKVSNTVGYDSSKVYKVVPIDTMPKPPVILDSGAVAVFGVLKLDSLFGMCIRATGTEPIVYTWYKNDTAIAAVSNDTLVFTALALNDSGHYYCIAQNTWGADTSKIYTISFGNFAPVWLHDTLHFTAYENILFSVDLSDSCKDLNNEALGYFIKTQSAVTGDTIINSIYKITPSFDAAGSYPFVIGANDREDTVYCPAILTVINVNRPPYFRTADSLPADQYAVDQGDTLTILFSVIDLDDDTVSSGLKATTLPGGLTSVQVADTIITWIAGLNDNGLYTLTLFATDKKDTTFDTITIGVGYVNIPPHITMTGQSNGSTIQIKESTTLACSLHVSDVNVNDTVQFLAPLNLPTGAQFIGVGSDKGLLTYTPGYNVSNATANTVFSNITFYAQDNGTPAAQDSFKINILVLDSSAPPIPVLQSPANNAVGQPVSLTLCWNASIGASSYTLHVSTQSDFSDTVFNQSITDTTQAVSNLSNNTKYYWRVNASNAGGTSDWSDVWNFTTIKKFTLTITTPQNGSITGVPSNSVEYDSGTTVTLTAVPEAGYTFTGWGGDLSGTTNPATITMTSDKSITATFKICVVMLSAGGTHGMILKSDGTLWATGSNFNGELGDGTTTNRLSPFQMMSGVSAVSAGEGSFTMILKNDSTLWATGNNQYGQLGDGTTTDKHTPVLIMSGVKSVSAGYSHTMILKADGTLWATGSNGNGQLGDGTTSDKLIPFQITTGVSSVAAGGSHTMILKTDGTLWATGSNAQGQLGDGTTDDRHTPFQIMSGVSAVSATSNSTFVLKGNGALLAMGYNLFGQLGDGTTMNRLIPVQVLDKVAFTANANRHTMVIKTDGTLWAFGFNDNGELGDSTTTERHLPKEIKLGGISGGILTVAAGGYHSMIVKNDGSLWTTGDNRFGQLGDGTNTNSLVPKLIIP